jgi:hypothetical protein
MEDEIGVGNIFEVRPEMRYISEFGYIAPFASEDKWARRSSKWLDGCGDEGTWGHHPKHSGRGSIPADTTP